LFAYLFHCFLFGDYSTALENRSSLVKKYAANPVFQIAVGRTIERRSVSNDKRQTLPFYILAWWIHGFLWGLSNEDRVDVLRRDCGVAICSAVGEESEVVRKTIARRTLKDWFDYRDAYSRPPWFVLRFREGEHETRQIVFRSTGQS
jgi:hypothetical protein